MRTCKRCKTNEAVKDSLNCKRCNKRNRKHTAKLIAESKTKNLHIPVIRKRFLCDCCGKEKTGIKHKMYDENWNVQRGCYECDECYGDSLYSQLTDEERTA